MIALGVSRLEPLRRNPHALDHVRWIWGVSSACSGNSDDIETIILEDADDANSISSECARHSCLILLREKITNFSISCGKCDRPKEKQSGVRSISVKRDSGQSTIHYAASGQSSALFNANWKLLRLEKALEPNEGDFWNADQVKQFQVAADTIWIT